MDSGTVEQVQFSSPNISGDDDASRLEGDLGALEGVRDVEVNVGAHTVTVRFDAAVVDDNLIRGTIEDDGYRIEDNATSEGSSA